MPDPSGDPLGIGALAILFSALGLSTIAGLRAYLPLLAVAIGSDVPTGNGQHLITLSKPFVGLGTWWLVALLVVLALGEFTLDKVPIVDHFSDAFHTIVRPLSGAIIMAGISNPLSEQNVWAAAVVGAVLALTVHTVKAASRPAVTATTAGLGNTLVSFLEDVLAVIVTVLAVLAPFVAVALLVVLAVVAFLLVRAGWRTLRARRQRPPAPTAPGPPPRVASPAWPAGSEDSWPTGAEDV
jgi:Domain of unknown function (DUF4126)